MKVIRSVPIDELPTGAVFTGDYGVHTQLRVADMDFELDGERYRVMFPLFEDSGFRHFWHLEGYAEAMAED